MLVQNGSNLTWAFFPEIPNTRYVFLFIIVPIFHIFPSLVKSKCDEIYPVTFSSQQHFTTSHQLSNRISMIYNDCRKNPLPKISGVRVQAQLLGNSTRKIRFLPLWQKNVTSSTIQKTWYSDLCIYLYIYIYTCV